MQVLNFVLKLARCMLSKISNKYENIIQKVNYVSVLFTSVFPLLRNLFFEYSSSTSYTHPLSLPFK